MDKAPAYISYVVLVHGGNYKSFLKELTATYPQLVIKFCKKVSVHYYILQLEDHSEKAIEKKEIAKLPIMAFREELSSFLIFKGAKALGTTLKRMCVAEKEDDASIELIEQMLTPFEKSQILNLDEAQTLKYSEKIEGKDAGITTSIISGKDNITSIKTLCKLFDLDKVTVDEVDKDLKKLTKEKATKKWTIGVL